MFSSVTFSCVSVYFLPLSIVRFFRLKLWATLIHPAEWHHIRLPFDSLACELASLKWNQRHQCWRCIPLQFERWEKKKNTQTCVTYFYLATSLKHKEVEKVLDIWYGCCFFLLLRSQQKFLRFRFTLCNKNTQDSIRMFQQAHFFGINYPLNRIIALANEKKNINSIFICSEF